MPENRISVVVAAPPMQMGGTERHLLHILPALQERGFDITAVLLSAGGALEAELRESVAEVVTPALNLVRPFRTMVQARLIRSAIRRTGAKVVHAFLSEPYLAAAAAQMSLLGRRPALVHGRRSMAFYSTRHPLAQKFEVAAHGLASALVGNSSAVTQELSKEAGSGDKVCLIHNGIPLGDEITLQERAAARRQFGIPDDALVLTQVANLHAYKGHMDLLQALGALKNSLPTPWRLLLPGRDSGEGPMLHAVIKELGLAENIIMPGEWPNSRGPYAAADIGSLVSHTEGFSNSLIEGMAAGLPMIATRVGGNLDAINEGQTGVLVRSQAPDELARAIMKLVVAPDLRMRLGQAAREMALARFSLERCVDRYERLWRALADHRSGRPAQWLLDP